MFTIKALPQFTAWLDKLPDEAVRGVVVARIKRLELGLVGDVKPVGEGVSELRIHAGAGWRIYLTQRGNRAGRRLKAHSKKRRQASEGLGRLAGLREYDYEKAIQG